MIKPINRFIHEEYYLKLESLCEAVMNFNAVPLFMWRSEASCIPVGHEAFWAVWPNGHHINLAMIRVDIEDLRALGEVKHAIEKYFKGMLRNYLFSKAEINNSWCEAAPAVSAAVLVDAVVREDKHG